jgi:hypothetical protein
MVRPLLLLVALPLASPCVAIASPEPPPPFRGVSLERETALQLLVANNPPFLVDVDTGRTTAVTGLPTQRRLVLAVQPAGKHAVIWLDRRGLRATGAPRGKIYLVRRGTTTARRIATGWEAAASTDGRGVWVKGYSRIDRCTLREVDLAGRVRTPARSIRCTTRLVDAGSSPILQRGAATIDPATGRAIVADRDVTALAGRFAVTRDLTVVNRETNERWTLPRFSRLGSPSTQGGLDQAVVSPDQTQVAISVSDPAWRDTGVQVTDTWLLEPSTRRLDPLPDMPARVSLKFTSIAWSRDGQLVILERRARIQQRQRQFHPVAARGKVIPRAAAGAQGRGEGPLPVSHRATRLPASSTSATVPAFAHLEVNQS